MLYYSTNGIAPKSTLKDAVVKGLASDKGLFMPEKIQSLPKAFFNNIAEMSLQNIGYIVANTLFGQDIDSDKLQQIVNETLNFDIPLVHVDANKYSLELFHGPTLAFKDVGARFMARLLGYFNNNFEQNVNVLVATSGDTGSAVANGFLNVPGVKVFVLYPKGKVSKIQECQFTTLGANITAIEVSGTFDDCQALVKSAFMDEELNKKLYLTSANSINVARFLPQMFYYFYAYAQLAKMGKPLDNIVVSVPSGNFGNITAGLIGKRMGLPIKRFIAANNKNDIFYNYLQTGVYTPKPSIATIANAMDVGAPSNFARILDLYNNDWNAINADISGCTYTDEEISETLKDTYQKTGYLLDPHGAVAYRSLLEGLNDNEIGVFLETAHPAKFKDTVDRIINADIAIPDKLAAFMKGKKSTVKMSPTFSSFKKYLMSI